MFSLRQRFYQLNESGLFSFFLRSREVYQYNRYDIAKNVQVHGRKRRVRRRDTSEYLRTSIDAVDRPLFLRAGIAVAHSVVSRDIPVCILRSDQTSPGPRRPVEEEFLLRVYEQGMRSGAKECRPGSEQSFRRRGHRQSHRSTSDRGRSATRQQLFGRCGQSSIYGSRRRSLILIYSTFTRLPSLRPAVKTRIRVCIRGARELRHHRPDSHSSGWTVEIVVGDPNVPETIKSGFRKAAETALGLRSADNRTSLTRDVSCLKENYSKYITAVSPPPFSDFFERSG